MKTEVSIAGRGLEELYQFLEDKGIAADVKYHFNHWFLSAEIAAVKLCGDREEIISILLGYYEGRKGKDVELTINNEEKVSFKGKDVAVIRQEMTAVRQDLIAVSQDLTVIRQEVTGSNQELTGSRQELLTTC